MVERLNGRCGSEDCYVENLVKLRITGKSQPWVRFRAPSADYNVARAHFREQERPTLAGISAARQKRLDKILELWDAGRSPQEIKAQLNLKGESVYQDLAALHIDPKPRATEARELLLERIGQLLGEGKQYKDIAPIVGLSRTQVGYICREHFNLDGRKRQAAHRTSAAMES